MRSGRGGESGMTEAPVAYRTSLSHPAGNVKPRAGCCRSSVAAWGCKPVQSYTYPALILIPGGQIQAGQPFRFGDIGPEQIEWKLRANVRWTRVISFGHALPYRLR